jgi:hypothetical protein
MKKLGSLFLLGLVLSGCSNPGKEAKQIPIEIIQPVIPPVKTAIKKQPKIASCDPNNKHVGLYATNHGHKGQQGSYVEKNFQAILRDSKKMRIDQLHVSMLYGGRSAVKTDSVIFPNHTIVQNGRDLFKEVKAAGLCPVAFAEWGTQYPYKSDLMLNHPEFFLKNMKGENFLTADGVKMSYLNLLHPTVREGIMDYMRQIAANPNISEIQGDDHLGIGKDFGYNQEFIVGFNKFLDEQKINYRGNRKNPSPSERYWVAYRTKVVTEFYAEIVANVRSVNPNVEVTLVTGPLDFMRNNMNQDHRQMGSFVKDIGEQHYGSNTNRDVSRTIMSLDPKLTPALLLGIGDNSVAPTVLQNNVKAVIKNGHKKVLFFGHRKCTGEGPGVKECQALVQPLIAQFLGNDKTNVSQTPALKPSPKPTQTPTPTTPSKAPKPKS